MNTQIQAIHFKADQKITRLHQKKTREARNLLYGDN